MTGPLTLPAIFAFSGRAETGRSVNCAAPANVSLTQRQMDCLRFIQGYIATKGVAPSYQDIASGIGVASTSGIHRLVHGLIERRYISKIDDRRRSMAVMRSVPIPKIGGRPLYFVPIHTPINPTQHE